MLEYPHNVVLKQEPDRKRYILNTKGQVLYGKPMQACDESRENWMTKSVELNQVKDRLCM